MKNRALYIAAIVFTALTVAAFAVAIAPVLFVIVLGLIALVIGVFALIMLIFGGLIGLAVSSENESVLSNVMNLVESSFGAVGEIFDIVSPVTEFCFGEHFSAICSGIGIMFGIVAIILTAIIITASWSLDGKESEAAQKICEPQEVKLQKKRKPKKKRTVKGNSILCLVLSCVFTALCVYFIIFLKITFGFI